MHCQEIVAAANVLPKKSARIFWAWEEEWEKVPIGPNGDDILETRLVRKYGGFGGWTKTMAIIYVERILTGCISKKEGATTNT